ncbi:uncharacterized protein LOC125475245 [Pyrus x bretschneideri]|uniref:uncharacterized protein LOC125475245 n=1 Tax=Pyrus x bretschneideri TaxID=225117 RepID=UPI00202F2EC9|nr:uncharacterized protein LOC125475245 [Pyrus x bretschneideri]
MPNGHSTLVNKQWHFLDVCLLSVLMEDPREKEDKEFLTEAAELDEALRVLDSSLSQIKWRLKYSRRRLDTDILALCTGMRPVILVDYGGKMPELQERLCAILKLCQKESPIFEHLRVMVIEEMIYLIHVRGLADHVRSSLNSEQELLFVDVERDPPKMITEAEKSPLGMQLISIQKLFSLVFPLTAEPPINEHIPSQSSEFIDLSSCMQNTEVLLPTLNGWLLGYPVVYLFREEHGVAAVCNLSSKYLHIYKISICRNGSPDEVYQQDELLSFSVPYDLSMRGSKEKWAEAFLAHMQGRWERCKRAWRPLQMEVSELKPQTIAF